MSIAWLLLFFLPFLLSLAGNASMPAAVVLRHEPARNALERATRRRCSPLGRRHGDRDYLCT